MLSEAKLEYTIVCKKLDEIPSGVSLVTDILQCILEMTDIATGRRKEYTSFVSNLFCSEAIFFIVGINIDVKIKTDI